MSGKDRSLEDIADGFPTDLTMAALVDADRLLSKQHAWPRLCQRDGCVYVSDLRGHVLSVVQHDAQETVNVRRSQGGGPGLSDCGETGC